MMKDIQLVSNGNGVYDWNFVDNDLCVVNGNQRLLSAVLHAVLLHQNELDQELYMNKGCLAHDYVKELATESNIEKISDIIRTTIKEIYGVTDCTVNLNNNEGLIAISQITIQKDDGKEVIINAI